MDRVHMPAGTLQIVGVMGHRHLGGPAARRFALRGCWRVLQAVRRLSPQCAVLTPLAAGADSMAAEIALALGLPLQVVRPYAGFGDDFALRARRRRWCSLHAAARHREDLPYGGPSAGAFEAAMSRVVDRCDLLLAVWDGTPGQRGGTAHAVARAAALRRPWVHVDPLRRRVRLHLPAARAAAGPVR